MGNGRLPPGYRAFKALSNLKGVKAVITPKVYERIGALKAYELLFKPKGVVGKIRARQKKTGGVSGLF